MLYVYPKHIAQSVSRYIYHWAVEGLPSDRSRLALSLYLFHSLPIYESLSRDTLHNVMAELVIFFVSLAMYLMDK